jgi:hypothetical protein
MRRYLLFPLILFRGLIAFSQTTNVSDWRSSERDSMSEAFQLFETKNYRKALPVFEVLHKAHPSEFFIKYCYGVCALSRTDKHEDALNLILQIYRKNNKIEDIDYHLAKAHHLNYKFDDALNILSSSNIKGKNNFSDSIKNRVQLLKQYCVNAKLLVANPTAAVMTTIGNAINTSDDEDIPLLAADESALIFTRADADPGNKNIISNAGVYLSVKENNVWLKPALINKGGINDKAIALSPDGLTLFIYHEDPNGNGDIYRSDFDYFEWSVPQRVKGINTTSWEGGCSITADGKTLYFCSDRPGGLGGKDIYRATLQEDKSWGNIENLGPNINSASDEESPFIHADGTTLFFSCNGRTSMGGYDIFQSRWNKVDGKFSEAQNLGHPINTPDDDLYYTLSANGNTGYYASGKKGGEGLKDICKVSNGYIGEKPLAFVVKGVVTKAMNVLYSDITIDITKDDKVLGEVKVNSVNGKYMAILPADNQYKLVYKYKSFEYKSIEINTSRLQEETEQTLDVYFDIKPELNKTQSAKDSVDKSVQKHELMSFSTEKLRQLITKYGDLSAPGLEYMVQIGAYKYTKNYDFKKLKKIGKVSELDLKDGIMRVVIGGSFSTLNKAHELSQKVIQAGQKDAFITILYKDKRIFVEDLETLKIFEGK